MKRICCALLVVAMLLGMSACGGNQPETVPLNVPEGKPQYTDDQELTLYAYAGPRSGGYRWQVGGQTHPDDPRGGWNSFITEKDFLDYKNAGFTLLYPETDVSYDLTAKGLTATSFKDSTLYEYMELAEKVGLDVLVHSDTLTLLTQGSGVLDEDTKSYIAGMIAALSSYDSFYGITLKDEPRVTNYQIFKSVTEYIQSIKSDCRTLTCMMPVYGAPHLGAQAGDGSIGTYKKYIQDFGKLDNMFCYDYYPLRWNNQTGENYLRETWFQNLELAANGGKEGGFDIGVVIQSCAYGPVGGEGISDHARSIKTKADVGYQLYAALAYGAKTIGYFTYWQHRSEGHPHINESFYDGMVMYPEANGMESVKTDAYYAVQAANLEVQKFDHVLLNYEWQGTTALKVKDEFQTLKHVGDYQAPRIETATATQDAIIGHLKDKDGYDGFMIVNAVEPSQKVSSSVTVKFREATSAIVYVEGEETEIQLQDGSYTFELGAGEGVFVIPIK
ncbi:MAG: hypothetical protein IJE00_00760 [Clostridia bacterium]|nr:hypothetical protein [Clostridia bacterium]